MLHWDRRCDGATGAGLRVALLDSGLNWAHPVFAGASIHGRDFTGGSSLGDRSGHGTANASLLIAQGRGGLRGLLPGCELLMAKVLGARDRGATITAVTQGLLWAAAMGADVIALPFGTCRGAGPIRDAIRRAVAGGSAVVAAAGNRGAEDLRFPAWLAEVTAVSAVGADGLVPAFCCAHPDVDAFAPGQDVPAQGDNGLALLQGTSPASVLAAAVIALQCAAHKRACGRA